MDHSLTFENFTTGTMEDSNSTVLPNWELDNFEWGDPTFYFQFAINTVGVVGNILVVIAYFMGDMFTVSVNYFVLSLACANLLAAILLLPIPGFMQVPLSPPGRLYCVFLQGDMSTLLWVCITASIFLTMTISIESFTAVRKPTLYKKIFCFKRYRRLITLIVWCAAFLTNTRHYFTKRVDENGMCYDVLGLQSEHTCGIAVSLPIGLTYILPSIVMITSYAFTVSRLRENMEKNRRNSALTHARHRIIGVVLIDAIALIICLAPSQVVFLLRCLNKTKNREYFQILASFETILLSLYVCANPVIYTITNPQFRLTLKTMRERATGCCRLKG